MTQEREIERILDFWLADGPTEAPDRVIDVVADRIERQAQQPAWRLRLKESPVNGYLKPILAVAAVIVVAFVGYSLLPGGTGGPGSQPSPSPSPTASPTPIASAAPAASPSAAPSASAVYPAWWTGDKEGAGILPAGSQTTTAFVPKFTFTTPERWVNDLDVPIGYGLFPDSKVNEAEYALSGETARGIFMVTVESPYHVCEAWEKTQGTAAERAEFLVASEAWAASEPVDVTIGGLTGKQVDVQVDPAWKEACPDDPPEGVDRGDLRTRVILLDTPDGGVIVTFVGSKHSAGHEAFLAEAMPIVESFQFEVAP